MITDERYTAYINSLDTDKADHLEALESYAHENDVPVIRREVQSLIRTLIIMKKPMRILEIGAAIGFSALCMKEVMPEGATITTIENYDKRITLAKANFEKYDKDHAITLLEGDANEILPTLTGTYDFIFMDAAKGQYLHFLPEAKRLLSVNGVLLSDNVLQDGDVIESRYAIEKRDRTIHKRMREYLYELKHDPELETAILTVGDGMALTTKKG
ncbi:MAG: O-methyltransferase [Lachnospiraceae bacterium]|nr:O-methyltransferase [Lachnospiraceae bacterium]